MKPRIAVWVLVALLAGCWARLADAAAIPISACSFVISSGGTYVVTNDLTAAGDCVTIAQPPGEGVTVNLNGFTIAGNGTGTAIVAPDAGTRISVVGPGTITNFDTAVDLFHTTDVTVKRLTVTETPFGILVGQGSITDSTLSSATALGAFGVLAGDRTTVTNVTASNSYFTGIQVGAGSSITQSVAENDIQGIIAGDKSRVKSSRATGNGIVGIEVGPGGIVSESIADENGFGIVGDSGANINKNTVTANDTGILATCPAIVQQNTLTENNSAIEPVGTGCTVKNNAVTP